MKKYIYAIYVDSTSGHTCLFNKYYSSLAYAKKKGMDLLASHNHLIRLYIVRKSALNPWEDGTPVFYSEGVEA